MEHQSLNSLHLARYRFHWRVTAPMQLPPYASSTLRGVFGRALRQQACLLRADTCQGCALLNTCPYPMLFEPQSVPRPPGSQPALAPYAIETPFTQTDQRRPENQRYPVGQRYCFDMVLMTPQAIKQLGLVIAAWQQAFANGVGPGDGTAALEKVEWLAADSAPVTIYLQQAPRLQRHAATLSVPRFSSAQTVSLHLQTPLRIVQRGKLIGERDITPGLLLRHLIRRVSFHIQYQQPDTYSREEIHRLNALADQVPRSEPHLQWQDWERLSLRQKQKIKLGGLVGHWQLHQVPPELLPFIYLGQWLHVGKEASFGMGQYQWR